MNELINSNCLDSKDKMIIKSRVKTLCNNLPWTKLILTEQELEDTLDRIYAEWCQTDEDIGNLLIKIATWEIVLPSDWYVKYSEELPITDFAIKKYSNSWQLWVSTRLNWNIIEIGWVKESVKIAAESIIDHLRKNWEKEPISSGIQWVKIKVEEILAPA